MKFAIIDDNVDFLNILNKSIADYTEKIDISCFTDSDKFMDFFKNNLQNIDAVFIDIELDNTTGLDIAKAVYELKSSIKIIFVTGYVKEYCQNIFLSDSGIKPFAFLTKPLEQNVLFKVLDMISSSKDVDPGEEILVKTTDGYVYLKTSDICYLESQKRLVKFSLTNKSFYEAYGKIINFVDILSQDFCFSHKSFLVNLQNVKQFAGSEAVMTNEEKIPISQRFNKDFKSNLLTLRGQKYTSEACQ